MTSPLIERLETGKIACPPLAPVLSHRPMVHEEWRVAGAEAAALIRELVEALEIARERLIDEDRGVGFIDYALRSKESTK